jgi:bacterioferritin-associated ferredoxin
MHRPGRIESLCLRPLEWDTGSVLTIIRIRVQIGAMIICVCKAVSDRHIRTAVDCGATSMRDLSRQLGVGTCCGKCVPEARATLSASLESSSQPDALAAA